jgi:hypothetical protein
MSGSSSLGTMTVGVSANVDPATKAVDALIGRMDRLFEVVSKAGKGSGGLQEWERTFERQAKSVEEMTSAYTQFKGYPTPPGQVLKTESSTKQMEDLGAQANRTRYAVLNLAYGVQDAATVFGTGGFSGALRASANNLSGLGVILANTQQGFAGLTSALMGPEFAIIGISTALMIGAELWDNYTKQIEKAAAEMSKLQMRGFKPQRDIEEAGRAAGFAQELEDIDSVNKAETVLENTRKARRQNEARQAEAQKQFERSRGAAFNIDEQIRLYESFKERSREGLALLAPERELKANAFVEAAGGIDALTKSRQEYYDTSVTLYEQFSELEREGHLLRVEEIAAEKKLKEQQLAAEKAAAEKEDDKEDKRRLKLQEKQDNQEKKDALREMDDLARDMSAGIRARDREEKDQQKQMLSDQEYRVNFLTRRRAELTAASRRGMETTGVAAFQSSAAYEALAKSRMQPAGDTELLQKLVKAQETATKELAAIREKLDPGRGARIAILEKIE